MNENNLDSNSNVIFFSHNSKDKKVVEPIAIKLSEIFGRESIFYDSWSIQPGDSILDKMDAGLKSCRFFFLFISKNSLESKFVEFEWQVALRKLASINNEMKFIVIRLEDIKMPLILESMLWIDSFTQAFETLIKTIYDIIMGNDVFRPKFKTIENLIANINIIDENHAQIVVEALSFFEPNSEIALIWENQGNLKLLMQEPNFIMDGSITDIKSNKIVKSILVKQMSNLSPGNPIEINIETDFDLYENYILVHHKKTAKQFKGIEMRINCLEQRKLNWKNIPNISRFTK